MKSSGSLCHASFYLILDSTDAPFLALHLSQQLTHREPFHAITTLSDHTSRKTLATWCCLLDKNYGIAIASGKLDGSSQRVPCCLLCRVLAKILEMGADGTDSSRYHPCASRKALRCHQQNCHDLCPKLRLLR